MLQIAYIRENSQEVIDRLAIRGLSAETLINDVLKLDAERRAKQAQLDQQLAEANSTAKQIGLLYKEGKQEEANALRDKTAQLKEGNKQLESAMNDIETKLKEALYQIPNTPHPSVPKGNTDADNEIIREGTQEVSLSEKAKPHWELTEELGLIDFNLGAKITGAGFPVYTGKGAKLQRALISFFLDHAIEAGYHEVIPPLVVNEASGYGTGQLPDKEGQMYHITADDLYLIPTAEVPVTNLYRDTIISSSDFPIKKTGYTPCFRREAGAYGKDVRGLNRLHQFDKVEIVQIVHPDQSYSVLEDMVSYVEGLLQKLELPYRVLKLCGGDLGFTSAITYDMEVYSAAQQKWLEVSSISNFETFQANRLKLRFKGEDGKTKLAHTLNGSALALPRIVAAILENNQKEDGIHIPKALQPYTGFETIN